VFVQIYVGVRIVETLKMMTTMYIWHIKWK